MCTIIELYNEEDSINHHGFSRKVFSGKSRQMVDIDKITINERISSAAKIIGMYLIWKVPAFLKAKSNYPNQQTGFLYIIFFILQRPKLSLPLRLYSLSSIGV